MFGDVNVPKYVKAKICSGLLRLTAGLPDLYRYNVPKLEKM
jgi:hypothetical protein